MNLNTFRPAFFLLLMMFIALAPLSALGAPRSVPAPDFELADLSGTVTKLSALRGSVIVLNFWATWCPECVDELSSLNEFSERYRSRGVTVLGVSVDRNEEALRKFLAGHPVRFPVLLDGRGEVFVARYKTRALPATVIVDRQGAIAARLPGRQDFLSRKFTDRIEDLLKGSR
jgi:peroxiredoxin